MRGLILLVNYLDNNKNQKITRIWKLSDNKFVLGTKIVTKEEIKNFFKSYKITNTDLLYEEEY